MATKCLICSLCLQLFIGFGLHNFINCDCPVPKERIVNGEYMHHAAITTVKERYILVFQCDIGYERIGPGAIQCWHGNWSDEVPSCRAMRCSAPPTISNGNYTVTAQHKNEMTIGTQAIYSCNPGYELSDPSVSRLTCILGAGRASWTEDIPACQAMKQCSDPGFLLNGTREGACCLPGDIVSYSCNEGFEMVGGEDIECLSSRLWSSPRPLCKPLGNHCELPPEIPNGAVLKKRGDYVLPNEEVEILCKPGYNYNGTNPFPYCNESALWEEEFGECEEIICEHPEPLGNGDIPELGKFDLNATFTENFVLTYSCNEGYRLARGVPWSVCREYGWSRTDPYCEEIFCPDPGVPEKGTRQGDSFKVGAKVSFKCFAGYKLLGSYERYCRPNGEWTGELTRCNAPANYCPDTGIPINGIRHGDTIEWDTIQFSCRYGFIQSGSKERTCKAGRTWSGIDTKCVGPHDFGRAEEIGSYFKRRLNERFDDVIGRYTSHLYAWGFNLAYDSYPKYFPYNRLTMYFVFDMPGLYHISRKTHLKKFIEFAKVFVRKIGVSSYGARVGALVEPPGWDIGLMRYRNTQDVLDYLDAIDIKGERSIHAQLWNVQRDLEFEEYRNVLHDYNGKRVLFLITDGKANVDKSSVQRANFLKDEFEVEIFCIGISGDVRADALYQIASTSKDGNEERSNVFILKNYERLDWLIQDLNNGTTDYVQCGLGMESKMNSNKGKMIGGERIAEPWPWMATLFFRDLKEKVAEPKLRCGGSIINENFILTAAHCLFERDNETLVYSRRTAEEIVVKLGLVILVDLNETVIQEFEVETVYIHDNYTPGVFYDNDIALLKLKRPITYSAFVRPVCLPPAVLTDHSNNAFYKHGEYGWVVGFRPKRQVHSWQQSGQYKLDGLLKDFRLLIQPNPTCNSSLEEGNKYFTESIFCARNEFFSGNNTCKGSPSKASGSPFMQPRMNSQGDVYWTQVGIASWSIGCGNRGHYGYYTRVQRFRLWIDEKIVPEA